MNAGRITAEQDTFIKFNTCIRKSGAETLVTGKGDAAGFSGRRGISDLPVSMIDQMLCGQVCSLKIVLPDGRKNIAFDMTVDQDNRFSERSSIS